MKCCCLIDPPHEGLAPGNLTSLKSCSYALTPLLLYFSTVFLLLLLPFFVLSYLSFIFLQFFYFIVFYDVFTPILLCFSTVRLLLLPFSSYPTCLSFSSYFLPFYSSAIFSFYLCFPLPFSSCIPFLLPHGSASTISTGQDGNHSLVF